MNGDRLSSWKAWGTDDVLRIHYGLVLVVVLLLAVLPCLWGIDFGLPSTYHPDELAIVNRAVHLFRTGDLNPCWLHYPRLYTDVVSAAYFFCYILGLWGKGFAQPRDVPPLGWLVMGGGIPEMSGRFLVARLITATLGVLAVGLSYYIASRLWGRKSGAMAALFVAVSSLHVANSQFAATDVPMTFVVTLSLAFCVRLVRTGCWPDYLLAGLTAGLALSTKYNAAPVLRDIIVGHSLHVYPDLVDWRLILGAGASFIGFTVGTPYAFIDSDTFWSGVIFDLQHYAAGPAGAEGENTSWWPVRVLLTQEGLLLLGVFGVFASEVRRLNRAVLALSTFLLLYYAMMARQIVRFAAI